MIRFGMENVKRNENNEGTGTGTYVHIARVAW